MIQHGRYRALVAVSRELHSIYALRLACQLSRLGQLDLDLLHVVEGDPLPRGAGWAPHSWAREREGELRSELNQLVEAVGGFCNIDGGLAFIEGRPRDELVHRLRAGSYDMVILGGSPNGSTGGVLRHLARTSPVPVLAARGYRPLRRVLICADGSPGAGETLGLIGHLLGNSTLETTLLVLAGDGEGEAAQRNVETLRAEGLAPRVVSAAGRSWEQVLAETAQGDYDLLVLAKAEAKGGLREMLGGDPRLQVALHAPCPVLIQPRRA